jgi:pyroglutamyl-peptidase
MARTRVLLTGFGPFPGVLKNPSAWLVERLAEQSPPEFDCELHVRVLPTEWQATQLMRRLYESVQPHVMIHFGLSARAKIFRIERSAHNRAAPRADAVGALPLSPVIHPQGPDRFDTQLPIGALAAHLRSRGVPAVASPSAGSYLCNFLYYHSLGWARARANDCRVLFVHIPPMSGSGAVLTQDTLLFGARETLCFVLNLVHGQGLPSAPTGPAFARREPILSAKAV